ncbi:MAG: HAD family phosphatase [Candidatus Sabulitectum sp.]|nr:HAD family phosphatase [Candidatus Sabulitectum sp.]
MSKLYISDLDGTLLRDDSTLSPFTVEVLRNLLRENIAFTVASARSVSSIQHIFTGIKLHLPVIEFNGAIVSDLESGEHLFINSIETPVVEDICGVIDARGCSPFISTFTGSEDRLYYSDIINDGMGWYLKDRQAHGDKRLEFVPDIRSSFSDQVICVNVIGRIDVLSELESEFRERYQDSLEIHCLQDLSSPGFYWLTAHDKKATKDSAIRVLQKQTGMVDREVVVFGDNSNDISMFKMAHRSIAVSNAIDELKNCATEVIGSNNEDSVARYIQNDWRKQ